MTVQLNPETERMVQEELRSCHSVRSMRLSSRASAPGASTRNLSGTTRSGAGRSNALQTLPGIGVFFGWRIDQRSASRRTSSVSQWVVDASLT